MPRTRLTASTTCVFVALVLAAVPLAACGNDNTQAVIAVPRVVGLTRTQAQCLLHATGFRWRDGDGPIEEAPVIACQRVDGMTEALAPDPVVRRQSPRPGKRVTRSTVVRFETDCSEVRGRRPECL